MRAALLIVLASTAALAHPPPPPEEEAPPKRAPLEWSSWIRLGIGMQPRTADAAARTTTTEPPAPRGQDIAYEAALGGDVTLPLTGGGDVRLGPWLEVRGIHEVVAGGELVLQKVPRTIDMFLYEGEGVLSMRTGGSPEHFTAQVAYGYLAPWDLFHHHHGSTRYMIGVRVVASYTRALHDPSDWIATLGLEFEPVGALRYLLGIRSWY